MTATTIFASAIYKDLNLIRESKPLILNLTNQVVMQSTANSLLALGAAPIMSAAEAEINDLLAISNALVINIGTLCGNSFELMLKAVAIASSINLPIVIDPVGAGASKFRTQAIDELLQTANPTVIRANASEIMAIAGIANETRGVDSTSMSHEALEAAKLLANKNNCTVVISGATDFCCDSSNTIAVNNGDVLMTKITGMGCTVTSFIAAFLSINQQPLVAAAHAMAVNGIAAEIAVQKSHGPGSFSHHLLDAIYSLDASKISEHLSN